MGQIKDDADTAFRDYVTDGDSGSGAHEPPKVDIRAVFALIDALVGEAGERFTFDSSTTTADDPGAGDIRLNHATRSSVTEVGLSDTAATTGNPDVSAWLATFSSGTSTIKGHLVVRKVGAPQNHSIYAVTAATDATTHWRFTVTHVSSAGTFSAGDSLAVLFVPKGDKGDSGAGGGSDQGWINVKTDHAAAGDGSTDDTTAIQAAIDAAAAAGGGTIYFPEGVYVVNGALTNSMQLALPAVDAGSATPLAIAFVGESPQYKTLSVTRTVNEPTGGSIIKGTLNSGSGAMLGVTVPGGEILSNITFFARDITFRMPTNPVLSALGLRTAASVEFENVTIDAGEYGTNATEPTTATSYGLRLPQNNNGAWSIGRSLTVAGFYNGIQCYEHTDLAASQVWYCKNALLFETANHSSHISRVNIHNCSTPVKVNGAHHFSIEQLNIEHDADASWFATTYDLDDASNLGKGRISYHLVEEGVGVQNGDFTKNGGTGVVCSPVSASPLVSNNTGISGADQIANAVSLTTAEYGAITPDSSTLYVITDA